MIRLNKIRGKDWVRLLFAVLTTGAVFAGLLLLVGSLLIAGGCSAVYAAIVLSRRQYKYLWQVVLGRRGRTVDWSNYYKE